MMRIRDATGDDLPAIVAIYNSTVPTRMVTADLDPVTVASRQKWFEEHTPGHRPLWVAEEEGRIAGWLSYSSFYGRPAYRQTCEISIYIAADDRRHGVGTHLLQRSIAHAPEIGVATLIGIIFAHNAPSLGLFARMGFAQWGFLPRIALLDQVERDVVMMGLRVD